MGFSPDRHSADEKALLDREHEEFEQNPDAGAPWTEARGLLRNW